MGPKVSEAWLVWAATFVATMVVQTRIGWRGSWTMRWRWLANARRGLANAREDEARASDHADHAHADRYCRRCPVNADAVRHDALRSTIGSAAMLRGGADDRPSCAIVGHRPGRERGAHRSIGSCYGALSVQYHSRVLKPFDALTARLAVRFAAARSLAYSAGTERPAALPRCRRAYCPPAPIGSARLGSDSPRLGSACSRPLRPVHETAPLAL